MYAEAVLQVLACVNAWYGRIIDQSRYVDMHIVGVGPVYTNAGKLPGCFTLP